MANEVQLLVCWGRWAVLSYPVVSPLDLVTQLLTGGAKLESSRNSLLGVLLSACVDCESSTTTKPSLAGWALQSSALLWNWFLPFHQTLVSLHVTFSVQTPAIAESTLRLSSSSASCCSLSCSTLVITLPTTSSREISLQLSQLDKSPFLVMGTGIASAQSFGTHFSLQAVWTRSSSRSRKSGSWHATFTISGRIPELPPAFPFLILLIASSISSENGSSAKCSLGGLCLTLSSSVGLKWLLVFRILVKCHFHRCSFALLEV